MLGLKVCIPASSDFETRQREARLGYNQVMLYGLMLLTVLDNAMACRVLI